MSIAITGCSGLIGPALWRRLRHEGHNVVAVGTALIAEAERDAKDPPSVLLSGSAIGSYGSSETRTPAKPRSHKLDRP
jgi:NAD dependent epimerase/dehydratase family enzyme